MADDLGKTDPSSAAGLLNTDETDRGVHYEDGYCDADSSPVSVSNWAGLVSGREFSNPFWADASFLGSTNKQEDCLTHASGPEEYCEADLPTYITGFDENLYHDPFYDYDFVTSDTFGGSVCTKNHIFPELIGQTLANCDPTSESGRPQHSTIGQDIEHQAWKKRKTSMPQDLEKPTEDFKVFSGDTVLRLFFKYNQDLTMRVLEELADDMGYSFEYVIDSYVKQRNAMKFRAGIVGCTPVADCLAFESEELPCENDLVEEEKGKEIRDTERCNGASENSRRAKNIQKEPPESSVCNSLDKLFRCTAAGCNMRFSRQGDLNRHSKKHRPGEHPCIYPGCGKVFYRKDKLRQHWEKEHQVDLRPPDLGPAKPRKNDNQDRHSGSSGSSGSDSVGGRVNSSDRVIKGRNISTPGSSNGGCQSDCHEGSSGNASTDSATDPHSEIDADMLELTLRQNESLSPTAEEPFRTLQVGAEKSSHAHEHDQNHFEYPTMNGLREHAPKSEELRLRLRDETGGTSWVLPVSWSPQPSLCYRREDDTKPRLSKGEVEILELSFKEQHKPSSYTKRHLAEQMGVDICRINNWFQNRRAKAKQERKQMEFGLREAGTLPYSRPSSPAHFHPSSHWVSSSPGTDVSAPITSHHSQCTSPTVASLDSLQRTLVEAEAAVIRGEFHDDSLSQFPKSPYGRTSSYIGSPQPIWAHLSTPEIPSNHLTNVATTFLKTDLRIH